MSHKFTFPHINLFFVSPGELDRKHPLYANGIEDFTLTRKGHQQADAASSFLADYLANDVLKESRSKKTEFGRIKVYCPFETGPHQTAHHVMYNLFNQKKALAKSGFKYRDRYVPEAHISYAGDLFLSTIAINSNRDLAQAALSARLFFNILLDDIKRHNIRQMVIVSSDNMLKATVLRALRYTPSWFFAEQSPKDGWIRHIHGDVKNDLVDDGYIFGEGAPLHDPMKTQNVPENAENIYEFIPRRRNQFLPPGVVPINPYKKPVIR